MGQNKMKNTIRITVDSGVVIDVQGLPDDWDYIIEDYDTIVRDNEDNDGHTFDFSWC